MRDDHGIFDEMSLDISCGSELMDVPLDSQRLTVSDTDILAPLLQGLTNWPGCSMLCEACPGLFFFYFFPPLYLSWEALKIN